MSFEAVVVVDVVDVVVAVVVSSSESPNPESVVVVVVWSASDAVVVVVVVSSESSPNDESVVVVVAVRVGVDDCWPGVRSSVVVGERVVGGPADPFCAAVVGVDGAVSVVVVGELDGVDVGVGDGVDVDVAVAVGVGVGVGVGDAVVVALAGPVEPGAKFPPAPGSIVNAPPTTRNVTPRASRMPCTARVWRRSVGASAVPEWDVTRRHLPGRIASGRGADARRKRISSYRLLLPPQRPLLSSG